MRFRPDSHVIDLLVGEDLYSTPDAAIRELLQNAEDACWLYSKSTNTGAFEPSIVVRYSPVSQWIEVEDNGIGMDELTLENSFIAIGASKSNVPHIRDIVSRSGEDGQIARFGIGILSCFGIADSIEVYTKMDESVGLAYRIPDYRSDFELLANPPVHRGTRIRLNLKVDASQLAAETPVFVNKHARHAPHVAVHNQDSGESMSVRSSWLGEDVDGALEVIDPAVLKGVIALNPEWGKANHVTPRLTVCNGGFLVSEEVQDLMPAEAVGYIGELDIRPGALRILMNREQYKKDAAWGQLQTRLAQAYNELISRFVSLAQEESLDKPDSEHVDALARRVLVMLKGPSRAILSESVKAELEGLVPGVVFLAASGDSTKRPLSMHIDKARANARKLFFYRAEQERQNVQEKINTGGANIQVTETILMNLRVDLLRAKGETVVACKLRRFQETSAKGNIIVDVHEADVLTQAAAAAGVETRSVDKATLDELELHWSPQSQLLGKMLDLGSELKVAYLPGSRDRVVRDFAGRILNSAHAEVRKVLQTLPSAVGNPIRRALIQAYMDLSNQQIADARERILNLLTQDDLEDQAALRGGPLQREYLRGKVAEMLSDVPRTT